MVGEKNKQTMLNKSGQYQELKKEGYINSVAVYKNHRCILHNC